MTNLIAAINMTLDGYCDHTAINPDKELHEHYAKLLADSSAALYGRITYQLMEYWRPIAKNPTGNKTADEFAKVIDRIPKIVFSRTLKSVDWESARLAQGELKEEALEIKNQSSKDTLVCSPSLIVALAKLNLIDEFQLCIHPVIVGNGLPLFKNINERISLKLEKTTTVGSGAVIHYYRPAHGNG